MALLTVVACVLAAFLQGINGAIVATQTPDSLSMTLDERVQINCDLTLTTSGAPAEDHADFYCQVVNPLTFGSRNTLEKKRLNGAIVATQTPDSLSVTLGKGVKINCQMSSGSIFDFTLTITGVLADDDVDYYCRVVNPLTFGSSSTLEKKRHSREIVATQTLDSLSATLGKGLIINCNMNSGSNYDSTLTFTGVLAEDHAFYDCRVVEPLIFGSGATLTIKQTPDSAPSTFNSMKGSH